MPKQQDFTLIEGEAADFESFTDDLTNGLARLQRDMAEHLEGRDHWLNICFSCDGKISKTITISNTDVIMSDH